MFKNISSNLLLLLVITILYSCSTETKTNSIQNQYHVIPIPVSLIAKTGHFKITESTKIILNKGAESFRPIAEVLKNKIATASGFTLEIEEGEVLENAIIFKKEETGSGEESYGLNVNPVNVSINAKSETGAFYAYQTLRQLLPTAIENTSKQAGIDWVIPAVEINDHPRFPYRGAHLDVARHFFDVEAVKDYIDLMAYHKLNYFHWHLTEDQGWRIEIKKYPKLTEIGAFRDATLIGHYNDQPHQFDGKRYGGFYTQEEVKEIIEYAAAQFITVIPEIELPGHAQAAIAAYPELGCTEDRLEVMQIWGVSDNVYCPNEVTFDFLENVLTEVISLFPGKYIHIGGDECPKTKWKESAFCQALMKKEGLKDEQELQSYFIQRIEKFINSKGRQIIGWDEILEGGLAPNATVMSWRGVSGGIEAAEAGHDVIMTPTSHCYFDYYQSDHPDEPLAIGGFLPLDKVYHYEPIPDELSSEASKHVLGTQANLWTEYISTKDKLDYMTYPRLSALSEVAWSPKGSRDFEEFKGRIIPHVNRLEAMGVNVANHFYDLKSTIRPINGKVEVELTKWAKDGEVRYTLDGTEPTKTSLVYNSPIHVESDLQLKAQSFLDGLKKGRPWEQFFQIHRAAGKKITIKSKPHIKYSSGGEGAIVNGVLGSNERYGDAEWLGFEGTDFEAVIDFGKTESMEEVTLRFFNGEGQWIYLPKAVEIFGSEDGKAFEEIAKLENVTGESKVVNVNIPLNNTSAAFLKIIVKNYGVIPDGRQGAGHKAWLFVDEVIVK